MPIKGISEKVLLPRLGKIRLGVKIEGKESSYPKAVDYFVCPSEVEAVFGEKPKELKIMFPTEDPSQWASQYYRAYSSSRGLVCKGDGEKAIAMVDRESGEVVQRETKATALQEMACSPDVCEAFKKKQCRPVMNLQFLLPEVPGLGIWQLDTSSFHSIRNINSSVALIKGLLGRISMVSLQLRVVPLEVAPDGKKKNVYVLELVAPYTLSQALADLKALPAGQALLPTPDQDAPDDLFPDEVLEDAKGGSVQQAAETAAKVAQAKPVEPTKPVPPAAKPVPTAATAPSDDLWAGMGGMGKTPPKAAQAPAASPCPTPEEVRRGVGVQDPLPPRSSPAAAPRPDDGFPMTDPQIRAILATAKKAQFTDSDLADIVKRRFGLDDWHRMTKGQAASIISDIQRIEAPPKEAA